MAAGTTIKHKRKAGAFVNGELAAGELGLDVTGGNWWFSLNGTTVQQMTASGGGGFTQEEIEDFVGAMVSGNVETGLAVTYDDPGGKLNFVVSSLDALPVALNDVSLNNHKLTGVAVPTSGQDAATKGYVDSLLEGRDWKDSVRVATTINGTLASSFANGQTVDGVVLATGNRILLKNQTTQADNGIYTVNASGAPTRSTDADSSADVTGGFAVWVNEGTLNADTGWVLTTNDPITLGTTPLNFTQNSGLGQVSAGAGLTKTGNTLDIGAGSGITVNADNIQADMSVLAAVVHTHAATDIVSGDLAAARMLLNVVAALNAAATGTIANAVLTIDGGTI